MPCFSERDLGPKQRAFVHEVQRLLEQYPPKAPEVSEYKLTVDWAGMGVWVGVSEEREIEGVPTDVLIGSFSVMDRPEDKGRLIDDIIAWDREKRHKKKPPPDPVRRQAL